MNPRLLGVTIIIVIRVVRNVDSPRVRIQAPNTLTIFQPLTGVRSAGVFAVHAHSRQIRLQLIFKHEKPCLFSRTYRIIKRKKKKERKTLRSFSSLSRVAREELRKDLSRYNIFRVYRYSAVVTFYDFFNTCCRRTVFFFIYHLTTKSTAASYIILCTSYYNNMLSLIKNCVGMSVGCCSRKRHDTDRICFVHITIIPLISTYICLD